ncbi:hypothetical protein [Nitrosomonas communis]|uniref:hypothetical protein n=1 Tax=Nitrosomonas communis TaxID=44574 RepID=UPI0015A5ED30|nr:hypothetical protein [Nitrosomonas communis]
MAKWNMVLQKTDRAMVHIARRVAWSWVVMGDVIDIGESARWFIAAETISRLRE